MKRMLTLASAVLSVTAAVSFIPAAMAATTAAPASTTAPAKKAARVRKPAAPRTAKSIACSKTADGKGLHGKVRKKFMESCKKAG